MNKKLHLVFWSLVGLLFAGINVQAQCAPVNVPYLENFEASSALPDCTSSQAVNSGFWMSSSNVAGFSTRVLAGYSSTSANMNLWFYTKAVNLQAGKTYKLAFEYANHLGIQSFKVAYGTSAVDTSMTNLIQDYPNVTVGTKTPAGFTFTPAVSGVYYFGFNLYTAASGRWGYLYLDNISVTEDAALAVSENQLPGNGLKLYPNPTAGYLYVKSDRKIANVKILDASGKLVKSLEKADQKIDVSQLTSGTYMMVVESADGTSSAHNFIKK
ncbi:MAG: T9SS type A sorting domain-containing protein [Chryseobacterium sp.]|uniref:T9SS type A sorting domain-containing protein n=1 Tax=Chryseobacterium sp. TaxID=1871047 RepID=UPI0025C3D3E5|nr:T9SS type A sorting domain-containing protein [Chryseobacterium sp.]MCJ7934493.1 T9SS type A sorting domain-containing protein [Chryseobacterium sp.]